MPLPCRVRSLLGVCVFAVVIFGLYGCGSDTSDDGPGAWTTQEGGLQLHEDLRLSEGENFYFGRIADAAVADDGRIYVADNQAYHVKILSPVGGLRDSAGTRGEGPGEFQHPLDLGLSHDDSLYVLDGYDGGVHVFTPGHEFERTFQAWSKGGFPIKMLVPGRVEAGTDNGFLFVYSPGARAMVQDDARVTVRTVHPDGRMGDTLFTAPPYRMASKERNGEGMIFMSVPFTPGPHFARGPTGRVHYGWSDSLAVTAYGSTGQPERSVRVPFESVPRVTDEEVAEMLGDRTRGRELVRSKIPTSKPAYNQFLVDDEGRYWFGRPTAHPDRTAWWVADPKTKRVLTDTLPSRVRILTVKNGHAYGRTTTDTGAPALVRYQIRTGN